MAGFTDATEAAILNAYVRGTAPTLPAGTFLGFFSVAPNDDGSGGTELTGNGYARTDVRAAFGNAATAGTISNSVAIVAPTASGAWSAVVAIGLFAASSGGTPFAIGTVSYAALATGGFYQYAIGALTVTQD